MSLIRIDRNPSRKQLNVFGVIWLCFFAVVGAIVLNKSGSTTIATIIWVLAATIPAIGWAVPAFMRIVFVAMAYAAFPIGFVVSHLILVIIYYLVLTPIGIIMRLFGYDPMNRQFEKTAETYWSPRTQEDNQDTYFKQF